MLPIRFKGREFVLVGDLESGGAITTKEAYENFELSYAHLRADGKVLRWHQVIGDRSDITVLEEQE